MQLNYYPINFEFEDYQINAEPYSPERLNELRRLHNETHSFFRNGDSIFISNKDSYDNLMIGFTEHRSVFNDNHITSSLIKHIFFRTFKDRFPRYTPVDFYPFRFFSEIDDIIKDILPNELKDKIGYRKLIEIHLRYTEINGIKRFGFLINIRRNWIFNISCSELNSQGFNLVGLEVIHAEDLPGLTKILAPNEEFVGVVEEIREEKAIVDTNDGKREFKLDELFIRKTKFNIGAYLTHKISQQKCEEVLNLIEQKKSDIQDPKNSYNEINKIANSLFTNKGQPILFHNKDGFCFTVDNKPLNFTNTIHLKTPTFIFDHAATKKNNFSPDAGLSNYGPYDSITFDIKSPYILCICNKNNRGIFTNFLHSLKDGLPNSKYFQKGWQKKYDLQEISFNIREISDFSLEDYLIAIKSEDERKPHLAIIEIPAAFKRYETKRNPYFAIKAKLLSLEIPVQFVTSEIINNYNEFILNSIALQLYAKLGGIPWVLPTQGSVDREIVIGIGHSWLRKNQFVRSAQNRVVGITTFLSSDGQYLLADKVKDVSFEHYFMELLNSLRNSLNRLSSEQGWSEGETVRLIFHIFKPIKNTEFDVISDLVREFQQYKIKFAFVTISQIHPIMLFDSNQNGYIRNNNTIGAFIPVRGTNLFIDSETCLVQMLGANELKTSKQGMSNPIQIKIRTPQGNQYNNGLNELIFHDLNYITQQIFSFTYLSWRSFLPGEEPATMKYANLISNLLGKMRNVPGWDADNLNYGLKRKKWFL